MKTIVYVAAALALSLAAPAWAKNFAFPKSDPAATITIPDTWKTKSIECGFQAKSPNDDIFFSIETASAKSMNKMMDDTKVWMKENNINVTGKAKEREINLGGLKGTLMTYPATDDNGETEVSLFLAEAGQRLIFMTLWASVAEQKANEKDIDGMMSSIKAIQ